jgi:hypothetical protein
MTELTPRKPRERDVSALVGVLAVIEGEMRLRDHPAITDELPDWMSRVGERLTRTGLLSSEPSPEELWTAVGNLNQRLRYVLGEYDDEDEGQTS